MGFSREELIASGQSVQTGLLTEWASTVSGVARRASERLQRRGVTQEFLTEVGTLIQSVDRLESEQERGKKELPQATEQVEETRDAALDWWREVRGIAKVEFGDDPNGLARFRTGVRLGGSVPKLAAEIEFLIPLLRDQSDRLSWLGVTEEFIERGETLLGQLREADAAQEAARSALSPRTTELNFQKGRLFDLARKLVRIGRLEFRREPEQAAPFGYDIIRRNIVGARAARGRLARAAAR